MRQMYGSFGKAMPKSCLSFVSRAAFDNGVKEKYGLDRIVYPVSRTRQLTKLDMLHNTGMPKIDVNPETFEVFVDGVHATVPPAKSFPMSQLYWFS